MRGVKSAAAGLGCQGWHRLARVTVPWLPAGTGRPGTGDPARLRRSAGAAGAS